MEQCSTCRFYLVKALEKIGFCRRCPPTPLSLPQEDRFGNKSIQIQAFYPPLQPDCWCGEWRAKAEDVN